MLILLTEVEYLVLLWYLLVFCHSQVIHLLSPVELQNFLAFLTLLVCCSGVIGALYSTTTKNAVIQADRASELEHANAELERAHATIQQQALTDGLTGLPNHRAIMDQLHKDMEHASRYERPFSSSSSMPTSSKRSMIRMVMPQETRSYARSALVRPVSCAAVIRLAALVEKSLSFFYPKPMLPKPA